KKSYLSLNKTYMIIISFVLFATFAFFYIYSTIISTFFFISFIISDIFGKNISKEI
ncbi:hypothetical protein U91_02577, partial [Staphylococcus aureus M1373]